MEKRLYHVVTSVKDQTAIVVFGEEMDMNDVDINEYLCAMGHPSHKYLEQSSIKDHVQGVVTHIYLVEEPLFEKAEDMIAYYSPESN